MKKYQITLNDAQLSVILKSLNIARLTTTELGKMVIDDLLNFIKEQTKS